MTSLEVSRQLFEVSRWENTDKVFRYVSEGHYEPATRSQLIDSPDLTPYYDSDYLLDKLPAMIKNTDYHNGGINRHQYIGLQLRKWDRGANGGIVYFAEYHEIYHIPLFRTEAGTPSDALALLAIKLIKEGAIEV